MIRVFFSLWKEFVQTRAEEGVDTARFLRTKKQLQTICYTIVKSFIVI